jgi:hypothetical protein
MRIMSVGTVRVMGVIGVAGMVSVCENKDIFLSEV